MVEEPPAENLNDLPERSDGYDADIPGPQVSGEPTAITPGYSLASATEIETGRYASGSVPGETQVYRVWVDFGQSLQVRLTEPPASRVATQAYGISTPSAHLYLYNPVGAQLVRPNAATTAGATARPDGLELTNGTAAINYRNRAYGDGADGLAGWFYVVYAVSAEDESIVQPYELDVEVVGEPAGAPQHEDGLETIGLDGPGTPEYTENEASQDSGGAQEPGPEDAANSDDSDDDGWSAAEIATAAGLGAAGVAFLAGAAFLLMRRRRG